jgi:hypothetical protein
MCPSSKILNQSKNGILTFCNESKLFQMVFNNLCFEFYEWELESFKSHLSELDLEYWEKTFKKSLHQRKIPISVGNKCFIILVNRQEISEIKSLLNIQKNPIKFLKLKDIDYTLLEN